MQGQGRVRQQQEQRKCKAVLTAEQTHEAASLDHFAVWYDAKLLAIAARPAHGQLS